MILTHLKFKRAWVGFFEQRWVNFRERPRPEGNASDSGQLDAIILQHIANTNVTPKLVNVDDGYTNKKIRAEWLKKGVNTFSIS